MGGNDYLKGEDLKGEPLLRLTGLKRYFRVVAGRKAGVLKAVDGVSLEVHEGETLALVGESGCGKSTLARCVTLLERPTAGQVTFRGRDLVGLPARELKPIRRHFQMVFQDPAGSLDPRMKGRRILAEPLACYGLYRGTALRRRVEELAQAVHLDRETLDRFPNQMSGGQQQRLAVARALALEPALVILDEPTSALDVSVQANLLNLLLEMQERLSLAYLFISHDLAVVRNLSRRVAVMYLGKIVETGETETVFDSPLHPYTKALLESVPEPEVGPAPEPTIGGDVPSPVDPPPGCRFNPRCPQGTPRCQEAEPPETAARAGHVVACHLYA